jgi:hypothetical protein
VDDIASQGGGAGVMGSSEEFAISKIWNEDTMYWVTTLQACDSDVCLSAVDSIQFVGTDGPMQYPDIEQLTRINSFLSLEVTAPDIEQAEAYQNMVVEFEEGLTAIVMNGTSGASIALEQTDPQTQAVCDIGMEFETMAINVRMALEGEGCPTSGRLTHDGMLHVACTGDSEEFTLDQRYDVTVTFEDGTMRTQVVSGGNIWTHTEDCM